MLRRIFGFAALSLCLGCTTEDLALDFITLTVSGGGELRTLTVQGDDSVTLGLGKTGADGFTRRNFFGSYETLREELVKAGELDLSRTAAGEGCSYGVVVSEFKGLDLDGYSSDAKLKRLFVRARKAVPGAKDFVHSECLP